MQWLFYKRGGFPGHMCILLGVSLCCLNFICICYLYDKQKSNTSQTLPKHGRRSSCWMNKGRRYGSLKSRHVELVHQSVWLKATKTHLQKQNLLGGNWKKSWATWPRGETRAKSVAGLLVEKRTEPHGGHQREPGDATPGWLSCNSFSVPGSSSGFVFPGLRIWLARIGRVLLGKHGWMRRTLTGGPTGTSRNRRAFLWGKNAADCHEAR